MDSQRQSGGNASFNLQARDVQITQGMSLDEIEHTFELLFKANFTKLAEAAADLAEERAGRLVKALLERMAAENKQKALDAATDPDFQFVVIDAQQSFARSGEEELAGRLIELLVQRSRAGSNVLQRIVLNEAINIAPKLTAKQINALSVLFLAQHVAFQVESLESLLEALGRFYTPLLREGVSSNETDFQHMEYAGCGVIFRAPPSSEFLINPLQTRHSQLFPEGATTKVVEDVLSAAIPEFTDLFQSARTSRILSFTLTTVGIALAHSNLRRVGINPDLSIWLKG